MDLAEIPGPRDLHFSFYALDVDQSPLYVELQNLPYTACQGEAVANRGRRGNGTDLLGFATDGIVLAVSEDGIKAKAVEQALSRHTDDQSTLLGHL